MRGRIPTALLAALAAAWGAVTAAQTPAAKDMDLLLGRGELLQFANDVVRVAVAEPKVADAVVVGPREVMINAKGAGYTTVVIWETGQHAARYNVRVVEEASATEASRKRVRDAMKEKGIDVVVNGDTVILTGEAKTADEARKMGEEAAPLGKSLVNLVRVAKPAAPRQVMLQVKFASVDRVALSEVGINLFSRNDKLLGQTSTQQTATPRFSQFQFENQNFANSTVNFSDLLNLFLYRPDLNIGATIRAMQSRNLLQILAEPNLIAVEGKEASFLAGGQFPFPTLTSTTTGGAVAPVITVQFKNFGVELAFTPTITDEGKIHLKVAPSVSALDFANAVQLQGFSIPAISTRTASTEVELNDGESFAIAGLLDSRVTQELRKIPWIGDVPVLGWLFKSRSTKKSQDELLVVVTPRFVKPLTAEEKAELPTSIEPFLQSADEELAKRNKKKKAKSPQYVGPAGYQTPAGKTGSNQVKGARPEAQLPTDTMPAEPKKK
ncbi:MAG: pilus assembly protein N-terminal domain-containing protein [Acidobacteria bacterium]|nr:pilus assembly protein N-terminal domain-containing protein [Acidobacteriota bacterium]